MHRLHPLHRSRNRGRKGHPRRTCSSRPSFEEPHTAPLSKWKTSFSAQSVEEPLTSSPPRVRNLPAQPDRHCRPTPTPRRRRRSAGAEGAGTQGQSSPSLNNAPEQTAEPVGHHRVREGPPRRTPSKRPKGKDKRKGQGRGQQQLRAGKSQGKDSTTKTAATAQIATSPFAVSPFAATCRDSLTGGVAVQQWNSKDPTNHPGDTQSPTLRLDCQEVIVNEQEGKGCISGKPPWRCIALFARGLQPREVITESRCRFCRATSRRNCCVSC